MQMIDYQGVKGNYEWILRVSDGSQVVEKRMEVEVVKVKGRNNRPVVKGQSVTLSKNGSQVITLEGSDGDGNALTYSIVTEAIHGTLVKVMDDVSGSKYIYTANENYVGGDSFRFAASDGEEMSVRVS